MDYAQYINAILKVICLITILLAILHYYKKRHPLNNAKQNFIKINHMINVGNKEKIAVIEWQKKNILIGITAHQITKIDSIDMLVSDIASENNQPLPFSQVLARSASEKVT